jgi:hypothetical protein
MWSNSGLAIWGNSFSDSMQLSLGKHGDFNSGTWNNGNEDSNQQEWRFNATLEKFGPTEELVIFKVWNQIFGEASKDQGYDFDSPVAKRTAPLWHTHWRRSNPGWLQVKPIKTHKKLVIISKTISNHPFFFRSFPFPKSFSFRLSMRSPSQVPIRRWRPKPSAAPWDFPSAPDAGGEKRRIGRIKGG